MTAAPVESGVHHDRHDASVRGVRLFGLGFAATLVVLGALVFLLYGYLRRIEPASGPAPYPLAVDRPTEPPEPRLQTNPRADLQALRAEEHALLETYGWIDQPDGIVHIPIDRAMALTVERGLPARPESENPNAP
jgi:hypothetical protein